MNIEWLFYAKTHKFAEINIFCPAKTHIFADINIFFP